MNGGIRWTEEFPGLHAETERVVGLGTGRDWFRQVVAIGLLYRKTVKLIGEMEFPAYRANIVAYLATGLSKRTGGRIDFSLVWRHQATSAELKALIGLWAPMIDAALRTSVGSQNLTEWFKKEDC